MTTLSDLQKNTHETEARLGLARAYIELSRVYGDQDRLKEATEAVQAAATAIQGLPTTDSAMLLLSGEIAIQQAILKHDAGDDLRSLELNEKAANSLRQAIEVLSQSTSLDAEQAIADIRYTLSRVLNNEALIGSAAALRTPAEVTKLYRDAVTQLEWVFERFPNRKLAGKESADTKNNLAEHLRDHDDLAGARKFYKDSFENLTLLAEKNPQQFEYKHSAILALLGLASTLRQAFGFPQVAVQAFRSPLLLLAIPSGFLRSGKSLVSRIAYSYATKSLLLKSIAMEPVFNPEDAASYEHGCSTCYQCGHEWNNILLNGATIVCLGCGTVSQIAIKYTPTGSLKESRRLAKENRSALKLQSALRHAKQRIKEKRMALKLILIGSGICIPTFIFDLGDYAWLVFWAGTCCFFVGLSSLAYLRSLQF